MFTGFNAWTEDCFRQLDKISDGKYLIKAEGSVRKIPHSMRYMVSEKGCCVMVALIETGKRTDPELAV